MGSLQVLGSGNGPWLFNMHAHLLFLYRSISSLVVEELQKCTEFTGSPRVPQQARGTPRSHWVVLRWPICSCELWGPVPLIQCDGLLGLCNLKPQTGGLQQQRFLLPLGSGGWKSEKVTGGTLSALAFGTWCANITAVHPAVLHNRIPEMAKMRLTGENLRSSSKWTDQLQLLPGPVRSQIPGQDQG